MLTFLRDKFDVLLIAAIFVMIFVIWEQSGYNPELKDFAVGSFGAMLAALGMRPRPNSSIDASTQTGDITAVGGEAVKKEPSNNEKPNPDI